MVDESGDRGRNKSEIRPTCATTGSSGSEPRSSGATEESRSELPLEVRVLRLARPYEPALAEHERARAAVHETMPGIAAVIESHLGPHGRMVGSSKTGYSRRYPRRLVVFNANLLVDGCKLWWGDLDLSEDAPRLRRLALQLGGELHVLYEHDGRFHGRDSRPLVEEYVYWTDGRQQRLGKDTAEWFEMRRGRPRRRRKDDS